MHTYYIKEIVPNIKSCHTTFRYDTKWWLFCRYATVTDTQVETFTDYLATLQKDFFYRDADCMSVISQLYKKDFLNATVATLYVETDEVVTTFEISAG
mmetsp:Transcript_42663/g.31209  ORF Transcript_42663/g.31209 Transcript_42663/m.31209 type:complete len:98 (+) Transcript_42663:204-497(+)